MLSITKRCSLENCDKFTDGRSMCPMHSRRFKLYGDPNKVLVVQHKRMEDKLLRWIEFPDDINDCWLWVGPRQKTGHGKFYWKGKYTSSYRAFYKKFINNDIDGLDVDHICNNPPCMNLSHLQAITSRANTLRGTSPPAVNVHKTECPVGHSYTTENTKVSKKGNRSCRECSRVAWRAYYYKRKGTELTGKWA